MVRSIFSRLITPGLTDWGLLILRVWLGGGMIYHGQSKLFGGMDKFIGSVDSMGMSAPLAWLAAGAEFFGGILIILGLFTPLALIFVAATMFVAAFIRHANDPFGKKELALSYLVLALALLMTGPGRFSLDARMKWRRNMHDNREKFYT